MIKLNINILTLAFCSFILVGCQVKSVTGAYIPSDKISQIQTEKPTKQKVFELIGYPTISDDESVWYYVAVSTSHRRAFFSPVITDAQILKLKFDNDKLAHAEVLLNAYRNDIPITSKYTEALGTEKNMLQQYLSTAGKYTRKKKKQKST